MSKMLVSLLKMAEPGSLMWNKMNVLKGDHLPVNSSFLSETSSLYINK